MMRQKRIRGVALLMIAITLSSCASTHAVRCDSKLTPINAPTLVKGSS